MKFVINCCLIVVVTALAEEVGVQWSYDDTDAWVNIGQCGGERQSPINIDRFRVSYAFTWPLIFKNYDKLPVSSMIANTGFTVSVYPTFKTTPSLLFGGLWGEYIFASYHFHWGAVDTRGSEHTVDTVRYPAELHLAHFKAEYGTMEEALRHSDGIAVLGVFLAISSTDNPAVAPIVSNVDDIASPESDTTQTNLYALASLLPKDTRRFYRYKGSLTTPTCDEVVTWTIFEEPIPVSRRQMDKLRSVLDNTEHAKPLEDNFRPVQPLNGRTVTRSWERECVGKHRHLDCVC